MRRTVSTIEACGPFFSHLNGSAKTLDLSVDQILDSVRYQPQNAVFSLKTMLAPAVRNRRLEKSRKSRNTQKAVISAFRAISRILDPRVFAKALT